jgi:hypothetical protein
VKQQRAANLVATDGVSSHRHRPTHRDSCRPPALGLPVSSIFAIIRRLEWSIFKNSFVSPQHNLLRTRRRSVFGPFATLTIRGLECLLGLCLTELRVRPSSHRKFCAVFRCLLIPGTQTSICAPLELSIVRPSQKPERTSPPSRLGSPRSGCTRRHYLTLCAEAAERSKSPLDARCHTIFRAHATLLQHRPRHFCRYPWARCSVTSRSPN